MTHQLEHLRVKIFADGADKPRIEELSRNPIIRGFTTNPTLMRQAGITDYEQFAAEVLHIIGGRPISFEVFSDDFAEMRRQALKIASWGPNVYVKVPVTNTRGDSAVPLVRSLVQDGVQLNVTAILTLNQVRTMAKELGGGPPCFISVFAGRIADTGCDPVPLMRRAMEMIQDAPNIEMIWASPRELLNILQANETGCQVITVTHDLLKKLPTLGRNLEEFSLDTVRMFHRDAAAAGFAL